MQLVNLLHIEEYGEQMEYWLAKGLSLAYSTDMIPEQLTVPYDYALGVVREEAEGCQLVVAIEGDTFTAALFQAGHQSHHIQGSGVLICTMIGNGSSRTAHKLIQAIKQKASVLEVPASWIQIQRRTAPYTYQCKYYKLR